jgi:hypothetical protein
MKGSAMRTLSIRGVMVIASGLLIAGCEQARLDEQVRELCAKDGGIKVYETVRLPAEKFDKWGMVTFYDPSKGDKALGEDYIFRQDIHYYRKGNPEMSRRRYQVLRMSDWKVLGEAIVYGRGGGDLPGPWHESSFHCPDAIDGPVNTLVKSVVSG